MAMTLADYIAQMGYRDIGGRYYDMSGDEPRVVNPEDEFYPIQRRAEIEGNVLSGLQKTAQGYMDPVTGKTYSAWNQGQQPGLDSYLYEPYQGLVGTSTQGDTLRSVQQPIGMFEGQYLTEGYDPGINVTAPVRDSYGLTQGLMDMLTGPAGMAAGAAFLPAVMDMFGGVDALTYAADASGAGGAGTLDAAVSTVPDTLGGLGTGLSGGASFGVPAGGYAGAGIGAPAAVGEGLGQGLSLAGALADPSLAAMGGAAGMTIPSTVASTFGGNLGTAAAPFGTGATLTTAANTAGTAGAAGTLSQMLGLTGNEALAVDTLGRALPGLLGAYAANQSAGNMSDLANTYMGYGAPSRQRFEQSMTAGFDPTTIPGYRASVDDAMNTQMRALSTQGNPFGNPGGLIEAQKKVIAGTAMPAINEYQRLNLGAGGLANLNAAVPGMQTNALQQDTGMWNALGYGINQAMNPPKQQSLADILRGVGFVPG